MKDLSEYDRPNTVSGLVAKHKELTALKAKYQAEIKTIAGDLSSLTQVIRLFDPDALAHPMRGTVMKPRMKRGALKRFVLDQFRDATEPLTSKVLTMAWAKHDGIDLTDDNYPIIRQKITSCIKECVKQDILEACGSVQDPDHFGSYKLYQKKEGGP